MSGGTVYTETVVHTPPAQFAGAAPYQVAIISLDAGGRVTARIDGERVAIDDRVVFVESRDGAPYFRKCGSRAVGFANPSRDGDGAVANTSGGT